jgi:hypothetical protein
MEFEKRAHAPSPAPAVPNQRSSEEEGSTSTIRFDAEASASVGMRRTAGGKKAANAVSITRPTVKELQKSELSHAASVGLIPCRSIA